MSDTGHDPADCKLLSSILSRAGDKWSVLVVVLLGEGPHRFNELKRKIGGISQRMLTFTLRGLVRDGLVTRKVFETTPPQVEYQLTARGKTLWPAVKPLAEWAQRHLKDIVRSRAAYDKDND